MSALVEAPEDIRPDGELYEKIVDHAYNYFNARLTARWNRVLGFWNGDDNSHGMPKPVKMEDYFEPNRTRDHNHVRFSGRLLNYLRGRVAEDGIQLDADWYRRQVQEDYKKVGGILDYNIQLGVISVKELIERRFAARLDEKEFSAQEELQRQKPQEMRAPTPQPVTDLDYYNQWGFESLNLMRQELTKLNPWGTQGLALTQRDEAFIRKRMSSAIAEDNGAYEQERIREAEDEQRDHREEMQWVRLHGDMSMEEYIVSLKARWDSGILTDDEQSILTKYVEDEDISEEEAFEYAQDAFDEDGETGQAIIVRDQAEIDRLNQTIVGLRTEAATTQTVPFLDDQFNIIERNFTGAQAIRTAASAVRTLRSKRAAIARDNPEIERLQAKINFAERFYVGIDAIFQNDVNVPSVANWRERNYNGGPLIRYVVWGMANPQPGVDRLLFKPQATLVRRLIRTRPQPSVREIQYMILTDRLGQNLNVQDILDVTKEQADAYKNRLLGMSPKRDQKPAAVPGTVEKKPKRGRRAKQVPKKKKKQPRINMMPGMRSSKAHTLQGSPTADDDGKIKANQPPQTDVGGDSMEVMGGDSMEVNFKCKLKF